MREKEKSRGKREREKLGLDSLLHASSDEQENVVDVREDEEEEDSAEEHGHPGAVVLTKHFQAQVST